MSEGLRKSEVGFSEAKAYLDRTKYSNLFRSIINGGIPLAAKTAEQIKGYKLDERTRALTEQMPLSMKYAGIDDEDIQGVKMIMGEQDAGQEITIERSWFENIKQKIEKMIEFLEQVGFTKEEIIQNV